MFPWVVISQREEKRSIGRMFGLEFKLIAPLFYLVCQKGVSFVSVGVIIKEFYGVWFNGSAGDTAGVTSLGLLQTRAHLG